MNYPPLQGFKLVLATLALSLAVFMEVLDSTIANVAVPVIAGDLGAATTQGTWVITSFAGTQCHFRPSDRFFGQAVWRGQNLYRRCDRVCRNVMAVWHCT